MQYSAQVNAQCPQIQELEQVRWQEIISVKALSGKEHEVMRCTFWGDIKEKHWALLSPFAMN